MQLIDPARCQIAAGVSEKELRTIAADQKIRTVQFASPLNRTDFENLESIVFASRHDITLRVYGHYGITCDLSFLDKMPSVRSLNADCMLKAEGVEHISSLPLLEKLWLDIASLESFQVLDELPTTIVELGLGATFSKKPSINSISRFKALKSLYLESQQKGIEAVHDLSNLEKIVLRSISTPDVSYLAGRPKLWSVDIKLGGIKDLSDLSTLNLKYLELWLVRGLSDLSFISSIESLQFIFLQSLKQVKALPSLKNLTQLRRVYLEDLKGLSDLNSLEFAPGLIEFMYVSAMNKKPEDLLPVLRNASVKSVGCGFGSDRKNNQFEELARSFGKVKYVSSDFEYR
jgi:hypothetical protein